MIEKFEADVGNKKTLEAFNEEDNGSQEPKTKRDDKIKNPKSSKRPKGFRYSDKAIEDSSKTPEDNSNVTDESSEKKPTEEPTIQEETKSPDQKTYENEEKVLGKRRIALTDEEKEDRDLKARVALYKRMLDAREKVREIVEQHKQRFEDENVSLKI
jgi:hypothetical protein